MAEHMALRSGHDQTLLMIAAASSDKMSFKTCVEALRLALTPHDVSLNDRTSAVAPILSLLALFDADWHGDQ